MGLLVHYVASQLVLVLVSSVTASPHDTFRPVASLFALKPCRSGTIKTDRRSQLLL